MASLPSKRIELTESDLREFAEMTQPGKLGCYTSHLTLVGVLIDTNALESILDCEIMPEEYWASGHWVPLTEIERRTNSP